MFIIALAIYLAIWKYVPEAKLDFFKAISLSILTAGLALLIHLINKFDN